MSEVPLYWVEGAPARCRGVQLVYVDACGSAPLRTNTSTAAYLQGRVGFQISGIEWIQCGSRMRSSYLITGAPDACGVPVTHGRVRVRAAPHQDIHGCIPGIRGVWVQGVGQTILRLRPTAEKLGLECRETTAYAPAAASHQDLHASLPAIRYHESGFQSRKLRKPGILYTFKLPRREAGPPNHRDDNVDSDQQVVQKKISLYRGVPGTQRGRVEGYP